METPRLTPAQKSAKSGLSYALDLGLSATVWGGTGLGKTTVLRALHAERGGALLSASDFVDAMHETHPLGIEEAVFRLLAAALR